MSQVWNSVSGIPSNPCHHKRILASRLIQFFRRPATERQKVRLIDLRNIAAHIILYLQFIVTRDSVSFDRRSSRVLKSRTNCMTLWAASFSASKLDRHRHLADNHLQMADNQLKNLDLNM